MSLLRGYADDEPLLPWLEQHIWPAEGAHVSHDFVRDGVDLATLEMIRSGTTTFSDMYFFPEACADSVKESGMRCQMSILFSCKMRNRVESCGRVYGSSTNPFCGVLLAYQNGKMVPAASGCGSKGSVSKVDIE